MCDPTECIVSAWSGWSGCSVEACGFGVRSRSRNVLFSGPAGSVCPALVEEQECNLISCPGTHHHHVMSILSCCALSPAVLPGHCQCPWIVWREPGVSGPRAACRVEQVHTFDSERFLLPPRMGVMYAHRWWRRRCVEIPAATSRSSASIAGPAQADRAKHPSACATSTRTGTLVPVAPRVVLVRIAWGAGHCVALRGPSHHLYLLQMPALWPVLSATGVRGDNAPRLVATVLGPKLAHALSSRPLPTAVHLVRRRWRHGNAVPRHVWRRYRVRCPRGASGAPAASTVAAARKPVHVTCWYLPAMAAQSAPR